MERRNLSGFTLLSCCKCRWQSVLHCKSKAVAELEEKKIKRCPNCASDDILVIFKRGLYRKEELVKEIMNDFIEEKKQ